MTNITITTESAKSIILSDSSDYKTRGYILEELLKGSSEYNDDDCGVIIMVIVPETGYKTNVRAKNIKFFPETFQLRARLADMDCGATLSVLNPFHGWVLDSQ